MALIKCPECGKDVSDTIENCIHCGYVLRKAEEITTDDSTSTKDNVNKKTDVSTEANKITSDEIVQKTTSETQNLISSPTESKNKGCGKALKVIAVIIALVVFLKFCSAVSDVSEYESRKVSESIAKQNEISSNYARETVSINFLNELDKIFSDYVENPVLAEELYETKPERYYVQTPGTIHSISDNEINIVYETHREGYDYSVINAYFSDDQLDFVKTLKKGDIVKVTGTFFSCSDNHPLYSSSTTDKIPVITLRHCTFEIYDGTITLQ